MEFIGWCLFMKLKISAVTVVLTLLLSAIVFAAVPDGNFDSAVSSNANQITVTGWAADRDNMNESLRIHVYVGGGVGSGAEGYEIIANKSRPDVHKYFDHLGIPSGEFYGFYETINVRRTGNQPVYVYAINIGSGNNVELGHKFVAIKGNTTSNLSPDGYAYPLGKRMAFGNGHDCAMPEGTPVYAVESGTANFYQVMGNYGGKGYATVSYGNYIELKCDNGVVARYGHLSRFEGVALKYKSIKNPGSSYKYCTNYGKKFIGSRHVNKGELIGYVGTTGNSTGNHLHFEFYINGHKQNVNTYFNK